MPEQPDSKSPSTPARLIILLIVSACVGLVYVFMWPNGPHAQAQSSSSQAQTKPTPRPDYLTIVGRDCQQCHRAIVEAFPMEIHGNSAKFLKDSRAAVCESCHGNSDKHVATSTQTKNGGFTINPAKLETAKANETCLQCHSRDRYLNDWQGSKHDRNDMSCLSCHFVHHVKPDATTLSSLTDDNKKQDLRYSFVKFPESTLDNLTVEERCFICHSDKRKAFYQRSTHLFRTENRVMKVNCNSCHNPHGGEGPKMLEGSSVNETCYQCHAEKRGPFLWEHAPVQENCMTCHSAHGSNNVSLLTKRSHQLCQQCHINLLPRHSTVAGFDVFTFNRGCTNCHSQIHGSNHPSGRTFTR